jgi:hypothetical protein
MPSHICYNSAAKEAKPFIAAFKKGAILTVGDLAKYRQLAPFGMQSLMARLRLPIGLGDVLTRVLCMIDKQQAARNQQAIALDARARLCGGLSEHELKKDFLEVQRNVMEQAVLLSKGGANDAGIVRAKVKAKFMKNRSLHNQAPKRILQSKGTNLKVGSVAVETTMSTSSSSNQHSRRRAGLNKNSRFEAMQKIKAAEEKTAAMAKCARLIHRMEDDNLLEGHPELMQLEQYWRPKRYNEAMFNTKADSFTELVQRHPEIGEAGAVLAGAEGVATTFKPEIVIERSKTAHGPLIAGDNEHVVPKEKKRKKEMTMKKQQEALGGQDGQKGQAEGQSGRGGGDEEGFARGSDEALLLLAQEQDLSSEDECDEDDEFGYRDRRLRGLQLACVSTPTFHMPGKVDGEHEEEDQTNDARPGHQLSIFDLEGLGADSNIVLSRANNRRLREGTMCPDEHDNFASAASNSNSDRRGHGGERLYAPSTVMSTNYCLVPFAPGTQTPNIRSCSRVQKQTDASEATALLPDGVGDREGREGESTA